MSTRRSAVLSLFTAMLAALVMFGNGAVALAAPTLPGVPTAVSASTDNAAHQATIKWSPPTNTGGSAITGYTVARDGIDSDGSGPWSTTVAAGKRAHTFNDLVPGRTYTLTVRAVTRTGTGGTASVAVSIPAPVPPGVPTGTPAAVSNSISQAIITWAPPLDNGGSPISGYRVTRTGLDRDGQGPLSITVPASARSYTFTRLGTTGYTATVAAVTSAGVGPSASITIYIDSPGVFLQPVTGLTATTDTGARTATISWSLGSAGPHGSQPDRFTVGRDGIDSDGSGPWSTTLPGSARTFTFNDLRPGVTYTLTVSGYFLWSTQRSTQTVQVTP